MVVRPFDSVTAATAFERLAATLTERAAEVLATPVSVVDERRVVVASSDPGRVGLVVEPAAPDGRDDRLRVPFRLEGHAGEVVIAESAQGEAIPARLAQALVELVINQVAVIDRLPNADELKDTFIHDLLRGPVRDETAIMREAQILGMDLGP